MEHYYISRKIEVLGKIGQPFALESDEMARNVFKLIKNKNKFKISQNTIWKIRA